MKEFEFILIDGATETTLSHAPAGWDDIQVNYVRHSKYYGLFRTFGISLRFVLDGAQYLREQYYSYGTEKVVGIRINQLNKVSLQYELFYQGEIDFSVFKDSSEFVEVNIVDGGLNRLLKANEKTVYSLMVEAPNKDKTVNYDHVSLVNSIKHRGQLFEYTPDMDVTYNIPITFNKKEVVREIVSTSDQTENVSTWFIMPDDETEFIFRVRLHLNVNLSLPGETVGFSIDIVGGDGVNVYSNSGSGSLSDSTLVDVSVTDTVAGLQEAKLQVHIYSSRPGITGTFEITSVEVDSFFFIRDVSPLSLPAFSPYRLFELLIEKIAPGYAVKSDFLEGLSWMALTSGLALRGIYPCLMLTSFENFFDALDSLFGIGLGIEIIDEVETVVIENLSYFLSGDDVIETERVTDLTLYNAREYQYNSVKVGFEDRSAGDGIGMNGRYEFNAGQEYSLNLTRVVKTLDKTCKYRADIFGIEMIVMEGRSENKAMDSDKDVFMFHVNEDGTLYRDYTVVDGFFNEEQAETVYNLMFSPKRSLKRHGEFLQSFLPSAIEAVYVSGDRNVEVESQMDTETAIVDEDANESFTGVSGYSLPILCEASAVINGNIHSVLTESQKKNIRVNGMDGIILEVVNSTANDRKSEIKMLLKSGTDLTQLIR